MIRKCLETLEVGVRMNGQIVNNLRFADDIDLIAETMEDLQEITDKVNENSKRFGLEINKQKNESCGCGEEALQGEDKSREYKLEQVSNFVYLSGLMIEDGKCTVDIIRCIGLASTMAGKFNKIWKAKDVSNTTEVRSYETFIVPVLLYGSQCWCLLKKTKGKFLQQR